MKYKKIILAKLHKLRLEEVMMLYLFLSILASFLASIIFFFSPFHILIKLSLYISGTSFFIYLAISNKMQILNLILPKDYKKKIGFEIPYVPRWKSKEFDEYVGDDIVDLYYDSVRMLNHFMDTQNKNVPSLSDYSFIVFPFAKAYEGILKKILVEANLIKEADLLEDPTLPIGNYFNPVGNNAIFNSLKDRTRDKAIPFVIYSTYQECRNQIMHYDSYRDNRIKSIEEARFYIYRIDDAIEKAYKTFRR
jgi:hypothetical protein